MKKILCILLFLFLFTGCNRKDVIKTNKIKIIEDKKIEDKKIETKNNIKYNKYVIEYINHDYIINNNNDTENIIVKNIYSDDKENISSEVEENIIIEKEILDTKDEVVEGQIESEKQEDIESIQDNTNEDILAEEYEKQEEVKIDIPIMDEENNNEQETRPVKVIDVSYYQGDVNWDTFKQSNEYYGVILRLGYYNMLDKKFERNLNELKRLNIPYGIYLFSYSTTTNGANIEADFTNNMIKKYDIKPTLGIYYDIESWKTKTLNSNSITKNMYDDIISIYINKVSSFIEYGYKVKVYSGRWYAMNRLGISKKYVDWVAEYNDVCKYDGEYSMWQYTSKGSVPGIVGNTDISYLY